MHFSTILLSCVALSSVTAASSGISTERANDVRSLQTYKDGFVKFARSAKSESEAVGLATFKHDDKQGTAFKADVNPDDRIDGGRKERKGKGHLHPHSHHHYNHTHGNATYSKEAISTRLHLDIVSASLSGKSANPPLTSASLSGKSAEPTKNPASLSGKSANPTLTTAALSGKSARPVTSTSAVSRVIVSASSGKVSTTPHSIQSVTTTKAVATSTKAVATSTRAVATSTKAVTFSATSAALKSSSIVHSSSSIVRTSSLRSAAPAPTTSPTSGPTGAISDILTAHNIARSSHGANPLTWSDSLTSLAKTWADACIFKHGGADGAGQNLAAAGGTDDSASETGTQVVAAWMSEESAYNPADPMFSHFTQVVWKASTQLGCYQASCSTFVDGNGALVFPTEFLPAKYTVCNYSPAGNVEGEFAQNVQKNS